MHRGMDALTHSNNKNGGSPAAQKFSSSAKAINGNPLLNPPPRQGEGRVGANAVVSKSVIAGGTKSLTRNLPLPLICNF